MEEPMKYDLVFEGGGAKGMVFVGALQEFYKRGHTPNRLLGTSAGAITAALVAAGYTVEEMLAALAEKENGKSVFNGFMAEPATFDDKTLDNGAISKFLKGFNVPYVPDFMEEKLEHALVHFLAKKDVPRHFVSFVELGGWFSADNFLTWLESKLDSGELNGKPRNFSKMTLADFYQSTGKDLTLCATDTTEHMLLALNHNTAPQCPVVLAVRMSMSIPLLWQEVVWKKEWGLYRDQDISGHSIVDGGVLSNFPIELFLSDEPTVVALMGPKTSDNVLGMLIDETLPVPGNKENTGPVPGINLAELETVKRINNLVNTMLEAHDKSVISTYTDLVVKLPAKGFGTTEFDMTDERRGLLVAAGRTAMKVYFAQHEEKLSFSVPEEAPTPQEMANAVAVRILR
jgi:NTE family protein